MKMICIENKNHDVNIRNIKLTIGKFYEIEDKSYYFINNNDKVRKSCFCLTDDVNEFCNYVPEELFKTLEEVRDEKLNQIL